MQAVANNPKFAKKVGVPQSVGKDFSTADKNRKTSKGGDMKHSDAKMDKSMMKKVVAKHADMPASKAHKGLKMGGMTGYASGGMMKSRMTASRDTADQARKRERADELRETEERGREYGRIIGRERQKEAEGLGGLLGTPAAYVKRAGQYIGDKFTDADAYLSEKTGMKERAASRRGLRAGLKEEGYKKGGSVAASKMGKVKTGSGRDGVAERGHTKAGKKPAMKKMARGGKTC